MEHQSAADLFNFMVQLSRQISGKDWDDGLEYTLWDALSFGQINVHGRPITRIDVDLLRRLSERADGWWTFQDNRFQFLTTDQWVAVLEE